MKITPIFFKNKIINFSSTDSLQFCAIEDSVTFENSNFDKKVLIQRGIIKENEDVNDFLDKIAKNIFENEQQRKTFSQYLKKGYISLSSNCYSNLQNPKSAVAISFNPQKSPTENIAKTEEYIKNGQGVGINFSNHKNPIELIKKTNNYFKFRENSLRRKPAGIAILNYTHPKIIDFITLKDSENYADWCFDLSIILPSDFLSKVDNDETIKLDNGASIKAKTLYQTLLNSMYKKGEPGIIFSNNPNYICDSCGATPLKENQDLTIGQVNLAKFFTTNEIDYKKLEQSVDILSKAMRKINPQSFIGILGYSDLLNKLGLKYGSKEANDILSKMLKIIQNTAHKNNLKTAISPTGTISRFLKTSPSIEPKDNTDLSYRDEIETLSTAQKYIDGSISKTIILKKDSTIQDVDDIIRTCFQKNIKGICVFKN